MSQPSVTAHSCNRPLMESPYVTAAAAWGEAAVGAGCDAVVGGATLDLKLEHSVLNDAAEAATVPEGSGATQECKGERGAEEAVGWGGRAEPAAAGEEGGYISEDSWYIG